MVTRGNDDQSTKNLPPFAMAPHYRDAGWLDTLPLPRRKKWPPPGGFRGEDGRPVTEQDLQDWDRFTGNLAVRAPERVVGLDVVAIAASGVENVGGA